MSSSAPQTCMHLALSPGFSAREEMTDVSKGQAMVMPKPLPCNDMHVHVSQAARQYWSVFCALTCGTRRIGRPLCICAVGEASKCLAHICEHQQALAFERLQSLQQLPLFQSSFYCYR
jgi:hypothetical protein